MARSITFMVALLLTIASIKTIQAVEFDAENRALNTAAGQRFEDVFGVQYSLQVMQEATDFIWRVFQQTEGDLRNRKDVNRVTLIIESMDGVAYTSGDEIHLSANYVAGYTGDVRREITGVLYHEMTHVWQWNGGGNTPGGLIEGIADFVRLKAGFVPGHWHQPGQGNRWDEGYDVTARFLDYCDGLLAGFVGRLNGMMKMSYSPSFFVDLLGKTVDQLWTDYKAKYSGN
ncbi:hypothetical protein QJS10_CPA02g00375 [Acorus calamus]|uniref:Uncharacterized protein n=1 Tax=Acorus calamus TaxID=4465 RepID=A0AAV9FDU2_ACOCL|nr:hypothetical protein QJS10_CPA02g00375 [Acorus calamus]